MCDNGGIYSLAGFAYQMKVFILQILQLQRGNVLEYETIDDVALKMTADNIDKHEDQLCSVLTTTSRKAIQVKRTNVTNSVAKKVLKNWILADKSNNDIEQFVLVTDRDISTDIFDNLDADAIYTEVISTKSKKSIDAKVKLIGYSEENLKLKIQDIISKANIQKYVDIDTEIIEGFDDFFIRSAVTDATYILRIKQLIQQITVQILDAVSKGGSYELTYEKMCYMKNCIISEITDDKWEPKFSEFRKLKKVNLNDLAVIKTREYAQLK